MESLEAVLAFFTIAQRAFRGPEAVERIAFEAVEDLALDGVRLAELRFSPDFMCSPHDLDLDEAMEAILRGTERATLEHDVAVGLIAIFSRSYGMGSLRRTVEFALRWRERLVGFDLPAREPSFPRSPATEVSRSRCAPPRTSARTRSPRSPSTPPAACSTRGCG